MNQLNVMVKADQPISLTAQVADVMTRSAVTVMDAHCALCARGAAWIAHNDQDQEFLIVPMQSELGQVLLEQNGLDPNDPTSWLLLERGQGRTSTDAIIRSGQKLGRKWRLLTVLRIIPRPVRDACYRVVARNRYRWFGQGDMCNMPDPEVQRRLFR
ncbi:thiol-disulfide oxidoreductase DCC family protein [Tropicibacter sp. Alg240-R139]|uniref:thiol-disulfide oxidoreductase DCC family protein n=1 Tax=Tropicibacter sp. Alg240-R139 TaxID=2305991 RepID=UPI0019670E4C|nr:DCC1-like thiol-disulfide oxidoreductase family protein [Tropicibacter sp. Alg240-R139]